LYFNFHNILRVSNNLGCGRGLAWHGYGLGSIPTTERKGIKNYIIICFFKFPRLSKKRNKQFLVGLLEPVPI
jgi:hypothetical protein